MITKFELFENVKVGDELSKFFDECKSLTSSRKWIFDNVNNTYKIPEELRNEFDIGYFLYNYTPRWKTQDPKLDKLIKNEVKKYLYKNIISKFESDVRLYFEMSENLKRLPIVDIQSAACKYTMFLFQTSINKSPKWIKDSNKYNL